MLESVKNTNGIMGVEEAAKVLSEMKNDIDFYKNAYMDHSQNALSSYIQEYNVNMYIKILKDYLKVDELTNEQLFQIEFFCYGGLGMTRDWILNDAKTDALEYTRLMHKSMPEMLKKAISNL